MDPTSVLVVDDEPGIALLCKRMLTRVGYFVTAMTDPREAVDWLKQNRADLLLVDIRMPEVDGFEVITHTRKLQPEIAVLVMTGFGTVETAIRALRQGVDGLLLKPFEKSSELVDAVQQALADSQQKHDASRLHTLRPLFEVTESLLSETRIETLLELIVSAILGQLRCQHAAYFQYSPEEERFIHLAGQGKTLTDFIIQVDASGTPLLVNSSGPGEANMQARLRKSEIGAAMLVPILRQGFRGVFFAGRNSDAQTFSEADLEMFQILARQAAAAIENARLYDEQRAYIRKIEESQAALLQAEKMAAAGRLSASIAHEVNNPLQSVQNCLHLAGREDLPPEKRKEYFDMARAELERLSVTVKHMLDFYRPGAARPEKVDLRNLINYVINLTKKQLTERGIQTMVEMSDSIPGVMAVSSQIQQVFINLILNSLDAMPDGGNLKISGRAVKGGAEILFQDSGPGIARERQSSIFEPFFSTKDGGTGLGLTVSYNIIAAHGGTLELLPDHGKGACFRVYLPAGGEQ